MGHHAAVARQDGMHIELFHAGENLLLQFLLTGIPRQWQRTAPPFEIVHLPPGEEGRTGNKPAHLILGIAQFEEHIAPDALFADDGQWEIHPVEGHPVDLALPALPVPERHGIRERAVVEVVAQGEVSLMTLLLFHGGEHGG